MIALALFRIADPAGAGGGQHRQRRRALREPFNKLPAAFGERNRTAHRRIKDIVDAQ